MGFISFTAGQRVTRQDNPDGARRAIDFFSYCAISFDALGALFALVTARSLLKVANDANDIIQEKYHVDEAMGIVIENLQEFFIGVRPVEAKLKDLAKETVPALITKSENVFKRLRRLSHIADHHLGSNYEVLSIITCGMVFFFVSLIGFMINSQPLVVWLPTVIVVALTTSLLVWKEGNHHPGKFSAIIRRSVSRLPGARDVSATTNQHVAPQQAV